MKHLTSLFRNEGTEWWIITCPSAAARNRATVRASRELYAKDFYTIVKTVYVAP